MYLIITQYHYQIFSRGQDFWVLNLPSSHTHGSSCTHTLPLLIHFLKINFQEEDLKVIPIFTFIINPHLPCNFSWTALDSNLSFPPLHTERTPLQPPSQKTSFFWKKDGGKLRNTILVGMEDVWMCDRLILNIPHFFWSQKCLFQSFSKFVERGLYLRCNWYPSKICLLYGSLF